MTAIICSKFTTRGWSTRLVISVRRHALDWKLMLIAFYKARYFRLDLIIKQCFRYRGTISNDSGEPGLDTISFHSVDINLASN